MQLEGTCTLFCAQLLSLEEELTNLFETMVMNIQMFWIGELLKLVKGEAQGCRDVPSLCWAATSLCHLAGCQPPACSGALHALLTLLAHRFPKVSHPCQSICIL